MEELTIQNEHETIMHYCINRELVRPKTNILTALKYLLVIEIIIIALFFCFDYLFTWFGISLSDSILYLLASAVVITLGIKKVFILSVELYQHYASEQTRRKCTLKPSCSEYAILALRKYGLLKGLYKSYIRLFRICIDNSYRIDYP